MRGNQGAGSFVRRCMVGFRRITLRVLTQIGSRRTKMTHNGDDAGDLEVPR